MCQALETNPSLSEKEASKNEGPLQTSQSHDLAASTSSGIDNYGSSSSIMKI